MLHRFSGADVEILDSDFCDLTTKLTRPQRPDDNGRELNNPTKLYREH
jgi:hypothetical protein